MAGDHRAFILIYINPCKIWLLEVLTGSLLSVPVFEGFLLRNIYPAGVRSKPSRGGRDDARGAVFSRERMLADAEDTPSALSMEYGVEVIHTPQVVDMTSLSPFFSPP